MSNSASSTLPNTRQFVSSLLPPLSTNISSQPSHSLQPPQRPLILTLHCLFPNELLPALDLLDCKLVTRLILDSAESSKAFVPDETHSRDAEDTQRLHQDIGPLGSASNGKQAVYYVRSSHSTRSRYSSKRNELAPAEGMSYEVRLQAWNCSCVAFAFAAFSGEWEGPQFANVNEDVWVQNSLRNGHDSKGVGDWQIGGSSLGDSLPICKHLLACVLAERLEGVGGLVEERLVSKEEMAGWAAGWAG